MKNSYFSEEPFWAGPEKRALKAVLVNNKNSRAGTTSEPGEPGF
jgi:hypothetical protein